jgi:flagellar motor switch protein FliG
MSQKNNENGVFLNGKRQVIELLKQMESPEKTKLLRNLRLRNPALAKELTELCISFDSIWDLNDEGLRSVLMQIQPTILGLALHLVSTKNQRRALGLLPRTAALTAYEIMQKDLSDNRNECQRAQQKVMDTAMNLHRNRVIQFY